MTLESQGDAKEQLCGAARELRRSELALSSPKKLNIKVRSLNGCWTCRVRRKKCDESSPSCSNCTTLNLSCDGYGPRPAWLDGGVLEKAKAIQIKSIVKQMIKRRFRNPSEPISSTRVSTPQTATPPSSLSSEEQSMPANVLYNPATGIDNSMLWDNSYGNLLLGFNDEILSPDDSTFDLSTICSTRTDGSLVGYGEHAFSPAHVQTQDLFTPQSISFETQPVVAPSIFEPNSELGLLWGLADTCLATGSACSSSPDSGSKASYEKSSVTESTSKINELVSCPTASDKPNAFRISDSNEAALLMHYIDHAFYKQFPSYSPSAYSSGRGWLLTLLTGDQTIYYATLAFSQYHRDPNSPATRPSLTENVRPLERVDYYVFALNQLQLHLREAHTWIGSDGVLRSMKALACILQFVFLEIFSNSSGNWSFHLKAADALLPSLVEARIRYLHPDYRESQDQELQDMCYLSADDHLAVEFLLGAFIWLDILAQASTRAKLSSHFSTEILLENGNIHTEYLFGCKSWVTLLISKISKLDDWKRECEKDQKLSVAKLARQGANIKADLNQGLTGILAQRLNHGQPSSKLTPEDKCSAITECFGLAALTYLHVVMSGAYPDLPEIDDSVSRGMNALRALRDRKLLDRAVWPVCVIGCMVSESKQSIFRCLITGDDVADMFIGTFSQATEIIEHCWKEREAGSRNIDWFSAMKSVGQHKLLL